MISFPIYIHLVHALLKRLSHSIYECKYHIVFCPKYRYRILRDEVAEYTRQQIYRLGQQKDGVEVLELKVQPDHVHLVVSIPPKYAVSNDWDAATGGAIYGLEDTA